MSMHFFPTNSNFRPTWNLHCLNRSTDVKHSTCYLSNSCWNWVGWVFGSPPSTQTKSIFTLWWPGKKKHRKFWHFTLQRKYRIPVWLLATLPRLMQVRECGASAIIHRGHEVLVWTYGQDIWVRFVWQPPQDSASVLAAFHGQLEKEQLPPSQIPRDTAWLRQPEFQSFEAQTWIFFR